MKIRSSAVWLSSLLLACGGTTAVDPGAAGDGAVEGGHEDATLDALDDTPDTRPRPDAPSTDAPGGDAPASDAPSADSGGGACSASGTCPTGLSCCNGACVNLVNDPLHCGACDVACSGASSMCAGSACTAPTCTPGCKLGQQCCDVMGPGPSRPATCVDGPTCPVGCPLCR